MYVKVIRACTLRWSVYVRQCTPCMYVTVIRVCTLRCSVYVRQCATCMYVNVFRVCTLRWSVHVLQGVPWIYIKVLRAYQPITLILLSLTFKLLHLDWWTLFCLIPKYTIISNILCWTTLIQFLNALHFSYFLIYKKMYHYNQWLNLYTLYMLHISLFVLCTFVWKTKVYQAVVVDIHFLFGGFVHVKCI